MIWTTLPILSFFSSLFFEGIGVVPFLNDVLFAFTSFQEPRLPS
jgi:hypothetical protein